MLLVSFNRRRKKKASVAPGFPLSHDVPAAADLASATVELSSVQRYKAPRLQQVVRQIEVPEYLPPDNLRSLYEEESVIYSVPARIETPRPVRGSLANLANMLDGTYLIMSRRATILPTRTTLALGNKLEVSRRVSKAACPFMSYSFWSWCSRVL
ncbi:hypothetical protein K457DRAFT_513395 [Linnemannia elongata AG-77]|uniref:Uncharacterized protein n=1 Tax=Linnemannia elongata AG-77 TaxID=1314771 RepID=A0A197JX20_9FUNG|nr:hypothetical protein K457DRAFT_513395 [Linnemannia elongata AG-77]